MSELMSSKIQNVARDSEERKSTERKRNLLYLIHAYLKDNSFSNTSETLASEAQITASYEVCDNIDLDIILQEYFNFYYLKFNKNPKILKKVDNIKISNPTVKLLKPKKTEREKIAIEKEVKIEPLTVTQLLPPGLEKPIGDNLRPLYDFPGFNPEWRELADLISSEIIQKDLHVKWDDIKGLENAKNLLKEAVLYPLQYPALFTKLQIPWKGILIYGPPGTGKTFLAKALASECHNASTFFNISASSLVSKWRGESEKLIRVLFELAKFQSPSTIFIDEIDALVSRRDEQNQHEASRRFKSELLIQMDGICNSDENKVFLLASSNLPWNIDPAILRRFEKRILVEHPSFDARSQMFKYYLNQFTTNLDIEKETSFELFAEKTEGYTGSDIKLIAKEACLLPIRRQILKARNDSSENRMLSYLKPVQFEDVQLAIHKTKPSTKSLASKYSKWHEEFGCV